MKRVRQIELAIALAAISLLFSTDRTSGAVIINEVLANEPGSETALEWVELYNNTTSAVDLSQYLFIEGGDTTKFAKGASLAASGFAILSRKPLSSDGSSSFESVWGNASGKWGDTAQENFLLISAKLSLRNSSDTVTLACPSNGTKEQVSWSVSAPDGVSLERINPYKVATGTNFGLCKSPRGASPGLPNSLLPPDHDLGILLDTLSTGMRVTSDSSLELHLTIKNFGLKRSNHCMATLFFDRNLSGSLDEGDRLDSMVIPALEMDSTIRISRTYHESPGRKKLLIHLPEDGDSTNNSISYSFSMGHAYHEFLINEFVANPGDELDCEWIELLNIANYTIDLFNFEVGDPVKRYRFPAHLLVAPAEMVILCQDSTNFSKFYGVTSCLLVEPTGWNSINNAGDVIILENDYKAISDSIQFNLSAGESVSWERDQDSSGGSFASLFYLSSDSTGSTPCKRNSKRILPLFHDLGITETYLISTADSLAVIRVNIENLGYLQSPQSTLSIFDDRNRDSIPSQTELVAQQQLPTLDQGDTAALQVILSFTPGHHSVICALPDDDKTSNNKSVLSFSLGAPTRELSIREFLANPTGDLESEWIEVVNSSDQLLDLRGWSVGDKTRRSVISNDIWVEPQRRFILAQDSLSFRTFYHPDCTVLQPMSWNNFNNSGDVIIIRDEYGTLVDSVTYKTTCGQNRSIELDESPQGAPERTWFASNSSTGSSPCATNSTRIIPAAHDLALAVGSFAVIPREGAATVRKVIASIRNLGTDKSSLSTVRIYDDQNLDGNPSGDIVVGEISIPEIAPLDSAHLQADLAFGEGKHQLIAQLPEDQNDTNNTAMTRLSVGDKTGEIVITEFLCNPSGNLETEWIELKNVSSRTINMAAWSIGDSTHQHPFTSENLIAPGEYFVAAEDSSAFARFYGTGCKILQPQSWSSLNNDGDAIMLRDDSGFLSDSVCYTKGAEDNHSIELNEIAARTTPRCWYSSTDTSGSTPCGANSVSSEPVKGIEFTLQNHVFAPSFGENLRFQITCPPATLFSIDIFDLAGRKRYTLAQSRAYSSGEFTYGGISNGGGTLLPGAYILKVVSESGEKFERKLGFAVALSH